MIQRNFLIKKTSGLSTKPIDLSSYFADILEANFASKDFDLKGQTWSEVNHLKDMDKPTKLKYADRILKKTYY